ncbi:Hypothetical protein HDN1F_07530 [gamma proteobacterium HdN1]|nr:Hypothetical protein HDN1F_07530 [gamma proteobacterium HdN1]
MTGSSSMGTMNREELRRFAARKLREGVPLVNHMQLDITDWQPGIVTVEAPLAPNLNTHGTAFGGSLYCLGSMAGWALMHLTLMDAGFLPSVWIVKGEINYRRPVKGTLRATASLSEEARAALVEQFRSQGKAKATITIVTQENGENCVEVNALFAAVSEDPR